MRCSCKECGEYMVHHEAGLGECICPVCGYKCRDCLGMSTLITKEELEKLKDDPMFELEMMRRTQETEDED